MGSSCSRNSSSNRERLAMLRSRLAYRPPRKSTNSKISEMIPEILEMVFAYFIDADHLGMPRSTLVALSRVNRHWARVVQSLLYRRITLTRQQELTLLLRTISKSPVLESSIAQLRIPNVLILEPLKVQGGSRLSEERQTEIQNARALAITKVMQLLGSLTNLNLLELHADNVELFVDPEDSTQIPKPLANLRTITTLVLHGRHDGRWLFLLKSAPYLSSLRMSPCWGEGHTQYLPFATYDLRTLHLTNDDPGFVPEGLNNQLTSGQFKELILAPQTSNLPLQGPPTSHAPQLPQLSQIGQVTSPPISNIKILTLVDIPTIIPDLAKHFSLFSHTLEHLNISYRTRHGWAKMTTILSECLSQLKVLQSLETNSGSEGLRVLPPSLKILTISLSVQGAWAGGNYGDGPGLSPNIGKIYNTIITILDDVARTRVVASSSKPITTPSGLSISQESSPTCCPSSLSRLTITDPPMDDFLHFNLIGDNHGYHDPSGSGPRPQKQAKMWMKAGQLGILVDVLKP